MLLLLRSMLAVQELLLLLLLRLLPHALVLQLLLREVLLKIEVQLIFVHTAQSMAAKPSLRVACSIEAQIRKEQ